MKNFCTYKITGLNLDFLIEKLKRENIPLYLLKKEGKKGLIITTSKKTEKKLFAITNGLCYNVIKIGENGLFKVKEFFIKRLSLILFSLIFFVSVIIFNGVILKIEVFGSGAVKKQEIIEILKNNGVKEFLFFNAETEKLEREILLTGDFSFCSIEKVGNRLKINANLSKKEKVEQKSYSLCSSVEGIIVSLKVFKGTAVKKVGDFVNKGEEIIAGYENINEEPKKVEVLGEVKIESFFTTQFIFTRKVEDGLIFRILSEEKEDLKITSINFIELGDKYEYTVEYKSYTTLSVGGWIWS